MVSKQARAPFSLDQSFESKNFYHVRLQQYSKSFFSRELFQRPVVPFWEHCLHFPPKCTKLNTWQDVTMKNNFFKLASYDGRKDSIVLKQKQAADWRNLICLLF